MEYELRIHSALCGDVIRLAQVAEAMARHAASGYGKLPFHGPTYENVLPQRASMLLGAAKKGTLLVCDVQGNVVDADELIKASKIPADWFPDFSGRDIHSLYVKSQHLIEWGRLNGDVFNIADSLGKMVEFDLKNESGDVVAAGYFRGVVGGGETNSTEPQAAPVATATATATASASGGDDEAWKLKARNRAAEIIKRDGARDLYPSQINLADEIAKEFRRDGVTGADGKPLAGSYIKRHALRGISSARGQQLSTKKRRRK